MVLADFFDSLLRGGLFVGLALVLGGLAWVLAVLGSAPTDARDRLWWRCLGLVAIGALGAAAGQLALLALKTMMLETYLGTSALERFAGTVAFRAGLVRAALALALGWSAWRLRRVPGTSVGSRTLVALAILLTASGAWMTHAAGRLEHRPALMTLTVLHQAAVSVWVGGLLHLAAAWLLARRDAAVDACWARLVARFSPLALGAVVALLVTALPLAWYYAGSVHGLVGSGYGSLLTVKIVLMTAAVTLAAFNLTAAREADVGRRAEIRARLPYLAQAEVIILGLTLFAAAALSAQPPAVDLPAADQATLGEVAEVFRPKIPSLATPSVDAMRRDRGEKVADGARSRDAYLWSNFSHNVAGLILLAMSVVYLVHVGAGVRWARHWPLGLVALAAFIYLRASANEGTWPFGSARLAQLDAEGLQHRIAAVLVVALGGLEWRVRARRASGSWLDYMFVVLGAAGSLLLLTHSHTAFQPKASFLVQVTHTTMGAAGVLMVAARWLELHLPPPASRVAGAAGALAMLVVALILVFYREANVVIASG